MTDIYRGALENTQLQDNLADFNLHCLVARALGGKQLCTSKVQVQDPDDLKGMEYRRERQRFLFLLSAAPVRSLCLMPIIIPV